MTFLGLPEDETQVPNVVIAPLPLELTVSYGKGTTEGPQRLLEASAQVELFDCELGFELNEKQGIRTLEPWCGDDGISPEQAVLSIQEHLRPWIGKGRFVVGLGGEHSVTVPNLLELSSHWGSITVVQIDAHCDLRDEYQNSRYSHACVARRALDYGHELIQVGVRTFAREEWEFCRTSKALTTFRARTLLEEPKAFERLWECLKQVNRPVYLSIDVDGLDPSVVPGTGTPEPGGLSWYDALRIVDQVFKNCRVVGMDLVELAPIEGQQVSEFAAARLVARAVALYLSQHG